MVPRPEISASSGNLLEVQIYFWAHPRPTESKTLRMGLSSLCFNKYFRWFWCTLKFEKWWGAGGGILGMGNGVPFWPYSKMGIGPLWPEMGWLTWGVILIHEGPLLSGSWGTFLRERAVTLWGLVGRGGLVCGLLPTCKQLFQYFLYHLGCTGAVSSDRIK